MKLIRSAVEWLKALVVEHPEDPIVRVQVKGVDNHAAAGFQHMLEDKIQPDDPGQSIDGRMVAIPTACAKRMDGITMDYQNPGGLKFHHTDHQDELRLHLLNWN
jgi:Fe-S cluster assembly iron-binding protein IscA